MRLFNYVIICLLLAMTTAASAKTFYVAPNGLDTNDGGIEKPFLTISRSQQAVSPGDTVWVRGGTYRLRIDQYDRYNNSSVTWLYVNDITKSGSQGKYIHYWAYPGETPIFDFSDIKPPFGAVTTQARVFAFNVKASWIHFKGLTVIGVQVTKNDGSNTQSECFHNEGSNNIYEQLTMRDGMGIGFYLTNGSNNLVLNCDAYNNYDPVSNARGGNVDGFGFHCKKGAVGNVIRGCRAWFNSDDGYDCISNNESVTFENCWAFFNGYEKGFISRGDGNGFKIGGYGASPAVSSLPNPIPSNVVRNCMAYRNKANGFYANHHPIAGSIWYNNTAYNNGGYNYSMLSQHIPAGSTNAIDCEGFNHILKNNLSLSSNGRHTTKMGSSCENTHNSFTSGIGIVISTTHFINTSVEAYLTAPRQADGSLPDNGFLRLKEGSPWIDKGTDVGLPYNGSAPDMGAFETNY